MSKPHSSALKSFNLNHASYDVFRPSFQPPLVSKFLKDLKLIVDSKPVTSKKILELAAGTGKFTKRLVDYGWTDNLIVVEPSEGMLSSFKKNFPMISNHLGSSYNIPLESGSVDAVIIAQGFHWFSDLESLKEIKRVLKPDGKLGCIWNFDGVSNAQTPAGPSTLMVEESLDKDLDYNLDPILFGNEVMNKYKWCPKVVNFMYNFDVAVPQYRHGSWRKVWDNNPYFKPGNESLYYYPLPIEQKSVFDYWLTRSYITNLPQIEKDRARSKVDVLLSQWVEDSDKVVIEGVEYIQRVMGSHAVVTE